MQSLTEIFRRLRKRFHTLLSAFRPGNVEARYKVVLGVCNRLPVSVPVRQRLLAWGVRHFVGHTYGASPKDVRPAQQKWDKQGRARLNRLLQGDERIICPPVENSTVSFIVVLLNSAHLSLLSLESIIANADVQLRTDHRGQRLY